VEVLTAAPGWVLPTKKIDVLEQEAADKASVGNGGGSGGGGGGKKKKGKK
ncbi:hypothetical protein JCM10212_004745, partial [Sporobolomyces blumeae]